MEQRPRTRRALGCLALAVIGLIVLLVLGEVLFGYHLPGIGNWSGSPASSNSLYAP